MDGWMDWVRLYVIVKASWKIVSMINYWIVQCITCVQMWNFFVVRSNDLMFWWLHTNGDSIRMAFGCSHTFKMFLNQLNLGQNTWNEFWLFFRLEQYRRKCVWTMWCERFCMWWELIVCLCVHCSYMMITILFQNHIPTKQNCCWWNSIFKFFWKHLASYFVWKTELNWNCCFDCVKFRHQLSNRKIFILYFIHHKQFPIGKKIV